MKTNNTLALTALVALAMLAGWLIAGERNQVNAQVATAQAPNLCYEITADATLDGRHVLLDKCTGDTWRFDDGYEGDIFAGTLEKVRPYSWQRINRN